MMKIKILFLVGWCGLMGLTCAYGQSVIRFGQLDLNRVWQQYGNAYVAETDSCVILQPHSLAKIRLDGRARRFTAQVQLRTDAVAETDAGVTVQPLVDGTKLLFQRVDGRKRLVGVTGADGHPAKGPVRLTLRLDGKPVYESGELQPGGASVTVDVPLEGGKWLELEAVSAQGTGSVPAGVVLKEAKLAYDGVEPEMAEAVTPVGEGPQQSAETAARLARKIRQLPEWSAHVSDRTPFDWLLQPQRARAGVYRTADGKGIVLANDMVVRTFRIMPNLATVGYTNRMTGESMLRAVSSEGAVWIDGRKWLLGGLGDQPERGYLKPEWLDSLTTLPQSFVVEDFQVTPLSALPFTWARSRWALNKTLPTGREVVFTLRGEGELQGVECRLSMAVYDGIPVIRKQLQIVNHSGVWVNIDRFLLEDLAMAERESPSGGDPQTFLRPNIHVESDFNCKGSFTEKETDITEHWATDPAYTSQRNYLLQTPCVLQVAPPIGPDQLLEPGDTFRTFRVYEMPFDSDDRERKGLFTRRFYRTVAPWTTENPIFMHLTSSDTAVVRRAVRQCADVGYEMIILSFGSGANAEDTTRANIAKFKSLVDYARSYGIEMGCYSLLASRWISDSVDVINPQTGHRGGMTFGSSPCLCSDWGYAYFSKIRTFFEQTGMTCFEHDGSYPGDVCASTRHTHHRGLVDSQWNQFQKITDLYHWMCGRGIYLNVPDFYFLNGSTKTSIGYREVNWSLPRDRQLIHTRQLNYDCTWERIPSSLWSFVPLVEYHGGGAAATLEPLHEHLYEYRTLMFQNYGAGVQACYRGPRLYDTPETRQVVKDMIDWYKKYRRILNCDIIHLRRPDAQDWDGIMHVSPEGKERALALFFNPTDRDMTRTVSLPLYYTGLRGRVRIRREEDKARTYELDGRGRASLTLTIPARGYTWYVVEP